MCILLHSSHGNNGRTIILFSLSFTAEQRDAMKIGLRTFVLVLLSIAIVGLKIGVNNHNTYFYLPEDGFSFRHYLDPHACFFSRENIVFFKKRVPFMYTF